MRDLSEARRELTSDELVSLAAIVGAAHLLVVKDDVEPYAHDWTEDFVAVVEAGVVTQTLHEAVEALGLYYPARPRLAGNLRRGVPARRDGHRGARVGVAAKDVLPLHLAPASLAAMKAVKNALDPLGILNPGKTFP